MPRWSKARTAAVLPAPRIIRCSYRNGRTFSPPGKLTRWMSITPSSGTCCIKRAFCMKLKLVLTVACSLILPAAARAENWPEWRGPRGDGTSLEKDVPVCWSETSNVLWKTEIPGTGHASPIVWEDRVFTVSALADTQERVLLCLDRKTGDIVWQKTVLTAPLEKKHALN